MLTANPNAPAIRAATTAPAEQAPEGLDPTQIREVVARAVGRACRGWSPEEREDIVQAALVRVLELERRDGTAVRTATYLWRVAYSVTVDEVRRRRRRAELPVEAAATVPAPGNPERDREARERADALRACLGGLAPGRRAAVTLHLHGHENGEAAALLGWDLKKYRNLAYRGLADLRECLRGKGVRP